jgi:multidrug efflux system membrane fusion protein
MSTETSTNPQAKAPDYSLHKPVELEKRKRGPWVWIILLCLLAGGAYYLSRGSSQNTQDASKGAAKKGFGAVPVVTATARKGDMDLFLDGLGTAQALNTVTVHTRVDGEIMKVAFTEGQFVKQGDLLIQVDPRPYQVQLEQAEGQLARDQAMLENAKIDLERYRILWGQDSIPKQQYDTQVATVHQDDGTVKSDQAAVDTAKLQLVYCKITSPLTGRIGLRLVDQGNIIHATDTGGVAVITQLQPITVVFNIREDDVPRVLKKLYAHIRMRVDAYDHDIRNKIATGELLTVDSSIDVNSSTLRFKAVFPNTDNALFPNQFVNARLLIDTERNAIIVPTAAIQRSPQSVYVYVVKSDNTVDMRNVQLGPVEGDQTCIRSGVQAGEVVVTEGVDKLQPGSKVTTRGPGNGPGSGAPGKQGKGSAGKGKNG